MQNDNELQPDIRFFFFFVTVNNVYLFVTNTKTLMDLASSERESLSFEVMEIARVKENLTGSGKERV